jgi:hypothetical protein
MATGIDKISGNGGFVLLTGTGVNNGYWESLVINEDAVFSALEIGGVSVLSSKGLSAKTVKAGMYLPTDPTQKITKVTLTSGSVIAYL